MRHRSGLLFVAAMTMTITWTGAALGQGDSPCTADAGGSPVTGGSSLNYAETATVPYTATIQITSQQTLPDGTQVQSSSVIRQARDEQGRTMTAIPAGCSLDEDGSPQPRLAVNIANVSLGTVTTWQVAPDAEKIAHVTHLPQVATTEQPPLQPDPPPAATNDVEDLGTQNLAGITAQGSRSVEAIPAGAEGNDLPLVVTSEVWRSAETGLTLLLIVDDPRSGRTTTQVAALSLGDPEPSLFQPPADYTLEDPSPPVAPSVPSAL